MKCNPGVSKKGLNKEYAYLHGWKITTIAKRTIMQNSFVNDDEGLQQPQINICS